jgi:hypothetical protein
MRKKIELKLVGWKDLPNNEPKKPSKLPNPAVKTEVNQWQPMSGLQPPEVIRQFDGMNQMNSFAIQDGHAVSTRNMTTSNYPAISSRAGNSIITDANMLGTGAIAALATYKTELHVITSSHWLKYNGSDWTDLSPSGIAFLDTRRWHFTNFNKDSNTIWLIGMNGWTKPWKYDGTSISELTGFPADATDLNFVTAHDNRLYCGSMKTNTLYFSALRKPEDWTTVNDAGQIVIDRPTSDNLTGLIAGSARLTVFMQNSIHELYGNGPSSYQLKLVTDNLGSPNGKSAQVIDGTIYFLGNDSVYKYSGGSLPSSDFSMQVRETIKTINRNCYHLITSWTDGHKYYLSFPTGTNTFADTVLEYDTEFNTWNKWDLGNHATTNGVMFQGYPCIGTDYGKIYKMDKSQAKEGSITINWEWVSKPFSLESLAEKTRWYRLWVVADIPVGSTLSAWVSVDKRGTTWGLAQNITADTDLQAKELIIPYSLVNQSNWVQIRLAGTGPVTIYEVGRQRRGFPMGLG